EILVTGSAKLDFYRFGGDSLQGRYHYLRLLPLTLAEVHGKKYGDLSSLLRYSGFPEPFSRQSDVETRRWSKQYRTRLVQEDLRNLEMVQDLGSFELLMGRLPACVGAPLSVNSLREDLQLAHKTVAKWLTILERLYAVFRLSPVGGPRIRAVKKEQKCYLFDWASIAEESARFENLVAVHLLKYIYWMEDSEGRDVELRYFRDTDGREVDFVVLENGFPSFFVECKLSDRDIHPALRYLCAKNPRVPAYQISLNGKQDYQSVEGIRVCPAHVFLRDLI
ncbi:MAG: AAA family ATPase, partial [Bdellovibrio sp.]